MTRRYAPPRRDKYRPAVEKPVIGELGWAAHDTLYQPQARRAAEPPAPVDRSQVNWRSAGGWKTRFLPNPSEAIPGDWEKALVEQARLRERRAELVLFEGIGPS